MIDDFYSEKHDEGYSPKTIKEIHNLLKNSLQQAIKWEFTNRNPAVGATVPRIQDKIIQTWNYSQVKEFLRAAKLYKQEEFYTTAVFTGARKGELLALEWKNVDLLKGRIYIKQTLAYLPKKGLVIKEPKTKMSKRYIALSPFVVEALKRQKEKNDILHEELGFYSINKDIVFPNQVGGFIDPNNKLREYYTITEKTALPKITFHSLRHTHATHLLEEGVNPKVVQERFGHNNVSVTLGIYSHVTSGIQEKAANTVEEAFLKSDCDTSC
ncbi:site-specific integrase (plasmid) [Rossellomorea sp. AcN35-11]|nr:site-specific integrase [Rossellomorea sp. AcN35-11]